MVEVSTIIERKTENILRKIQNINFQMQKLNLEMKKLNLKTPKLKKPRKYLRKLSWINALKKALVSLMDKGNENF